MRTFEPVFEAFKGPTKFAEAIGIPAFHANSMKQRDSIPAAYFRRVAAAARKIDGASWITVELLAVIAEAKAEDRIARAATLVPAPGAGSRTKTRV